MINLMAPINQLGYGVAGLNILKSLQKQCEVSLFPIGQPQVTNQADADAVTKGIEASKLFDSQAPCVKIWHQNQMAERIGSGKFIGFPIFELDTFTDLEKHHLSACDEWMVCSNWARDIIQSSVSFKPTHVVPLGVDAELFSPAPVREDDKTIFFNCGKWEVRKGHDILIEAFKKVSDNNKNIELWMMCTNPFNSPEEEAQWHQLYSHPQVRIIPRAETQQEVYNIMSKVDCGVFPSRGEGWNLELLELMSCGKHVIATNYSAHTEFCTQENSSLVSIRDVEPAFDNKWFFGQGNWANLDDTAINELQAQMEKFIQNHDGGLNLEGIETARQFSWDNTANGILSNV
tara:strand:- start:25305 stop:26342 length:1038 start_codon:yes stop_codon:yes gene_type:complete